MKLTRKDAFIINILFAIIIIFISILNINDAMYFMYIFPILIITFLVFIGIYYKKVHNHFMNFDFIFIILLWLFGMSRQVTYWFGFDSYTSYYGNFELSVYFRAYLFTFMCIFLYYVGSFKTINYEINYNYDLNDKSYYIERIRRIVFIIFIICLLPMVYYYYKLINVSMVAKYGSKQYVEMIENTNYLISLLRVFGVISLIILVFIEFHAKTKFRYFIFILFLSIGIISLLCGSRTEGLSIYLLFICMFVRKAKLSLIKKIGLIISIILLIIMIPLFFEIRMDITNIKNIDFLSYFSFDSIWSAFHELGGSETAMLLVVDGNYGVQYGQSILLAVFNTLFNFLPSSIRPDLSSIGPVSLAYYFTKELNLNYGLGFSLFGEMFLNFSWFGCLFFLILRICLDKLYNKSDFISVLKSFIMIYILFTMPRRETKDLFTEIVYYYLPFSILLYFVCKPYYSSYKERVELF